MSLRMSSTGAALRGLGTVLGSPTLVAWLWLVNFVVALPAAFILSQSLSDSIGGSVVGEDLRTGFDMGWFGEYHSRARGIEQTFSPTHTGAGAMFDNLDAWFNGSLFHVPPSLLILGVAYALTWAFFSGGILHRYGEGAGLFRLGEFLSMSAAFSLRFVRLAAIAGVLYYGIYKLAGGLFSAVEERTKDMTAEESVLAYVLAASALVVFLLTFVNMVVDYARIATFRENRRSMVLAMVKGLGFVLSHLGRTAALYYGLGFSGLVVLLLYHGMAPGAMQSTTTGVFLAFVVGQVYLLVKLVLRLTFFASQLVLYDAETW